MTGAVKEWNAVSIDMGCEYSASCLACPLPICKDEISLSTQLLIYRDAVIVKEIQESNQQHAQTAARLGVSHGVVKQAWHDRFKVSQETKDNITNSEWIQRLINGSG